MEKIYPTIEEISTAEITRKCPEPQCTAIFKCKSNLNLHLAKHHRNAKCAQRLLKASTLKEFHCPIENCPYHTVKSFKLMKYLRQHYLKVHSEKKHKCTNCQLCFSTETLMNFHSDFCGVVFYCTECSAKYNCYDTLMTHARRKTHKIFPKINYKALSNGDINACSRIMCLIAGKPKETIILPKDFLSISSLEDKADDKSSETKVNSKVVKRKRKGTEMHTQTHFKAVFSSTETQTEVISVHAGNIDTSIMNKMKKSIKTQTATITSSSRACNTSFDINFIELGDDLLEVETNSLGTQTLCTNILSASIGNESLNNLQANSTRIETDLLDSYIDDIGNTNYCNADMETQTDWFNSDLELLANDVQANNFTQTCDDILPPDLRFNNTHTQTVLNDVLRSVGSQTNCTRSNGNICTTTETQTDSIFEVLLEEINS